MAEYAGGYVQGGYAPFVDVEPPAVESDFGDTPDLSVQVDFIHDINPLTDPLPAPRWTELVHLLRSPQGFATRRGRDRGSDKIEAGTATAVLDDFDRALDPSNDAGPYAPNIVPSRRIRFSSLHESTSTGFRLGTSHLGGGDRLGGGPGVLRNPLWDGVIDSWGYDYPEMGLDATVTIRATDLMGVMNKDPITLPIGVMAAGFRTMDFILNERAYTGRVAGSSDTYLPSPDRDIGATDLATAVENSMLTGFFDLYSGSMLGAIQLVEISEGGAFFVARDGRITYRDRTWPYRPTNPALRFAVDAEIWQNLARVYDETLIYNDVTVQNATGMPGLVRVQDAASQARYGVRTLPGGALDTALASATDWTVRATELLRKYRQPRIGITRLDLTDVVQDWRLILGIELWDKVILVVPLPNGDVLEQVSLVEGITIAATSRKRWSVVLSLSVAPFPELLTDEQASFEGGSTVGWNAGPNTTLANAKNGLVAGEVGGPEGVLGFTSAVHGQHMMRLLPTVDGNVSAYTDPIPIDPRVSYHGEIPVKQAQRVGPGGGGTQRMAHVEIDWLDAGLITLSSALSVAEMERYRQWLSVGLTARAPSGAAYAVLRVAVASAVEGVGHFVDGVSFQRSA